MTKSIFHKLRENFFTILVGLYPAALVAGTAISEAINFSLIIFFFISKLCPPKLVLDKKQAFFVVINYLFLFNN